MWNIYRAIHGTLGTREAGKRREEERTPLRPDLADLIWPLIAAATVRQFVIAGVPAGFAVHQTVAAEPNLDLRLAEDAVFVAGAVRLGLFTLRAYNLTCGLGRHSSSVDRAGGWENVTEVMRGQRLEVRLQR